MEKETINISIISLILSAISLFVTIFYFYKSLREASEKSRVEILPILDINIFTTFMNLDLETQKFQFILYIDNMGSGIANNIKMKSYIEKTALNLPFDFINKMCTNCIFYTGDIKELEDQTKKIEFELTFEDLLGNRYSQKFKVELRLSKNGSLNYLPVVKTNYYKQGRYLGSLENNSLFNGGISLNLIGEETIYSYIVTREVSMIKKI